MVVSRRLMKDELWCYSILISAVASLAPIYPILVTVGLLVAADTVLGVWASLKRGETLTSNKASRVISKVFVYQIVLCILFMVETNVWGNWLPAVKLAAGAIAVVEVISLLENSGTILGQPLFKFLIDKLGSKSRK